MLSIRLTRTGKIHEPHYRIVVQEKRSKLNGKSIDIVGHYHPAQKDKLLVVDAEKIKKWLSQGAQPSDTVTNLLVKEGILPKESKITHFYTPKSKEAGTEAPVAATPAVEVSVEEVSPAEVVAETPAKETPAEPVVEEPAK